MNRPPSVIVERLGTENAARLSAIVGGTRLHVPGRLDNAGRLKRLLGDQLAILVVLHFGDSRLSVPMATPAPRGSIDGRKIERLTRKGWSASRIARKLGCSVWTVYAKRANLRPAHGSIDLRTGEK